jgi:hypothetical protein
MRNPHGMLNFFWDMYQQGQIHDARAAAERARGDAARTGRGLEARIDSLTLTVMAIGRSCRRSSASPSRTSPPASASST